MNDIRDSELFIKLPYTLLNVQVQVSHFVDIIDGCPWAEPKLPTLLKMLICIQNELDENAAFPLVIDLTTTDLPDTACPYHLSF